MVEGRRSVAEPPGIIADPTARAERESLNAIRQAGLVEEIVLQHLDPERPFRLRPSTILTLNRVAMDGLSAYAGLWRPAGVVIADSPHVPVGAHLVPELIEDMCDYVNFNWDREAVHLAAYCMWRLGWIHPFTDGNGRTSRALSYLVLSLRLGYLLPGTSGRTIPEQIVENRTPYFQALEAADDAWRNDVLDVSAMESLLERMLAVQLRSVVGPADDA